CRWRTARSEAKQRLKGGHRCPPTIVPEYELVQVDLELCSTDTMVRPDQLDSERWRNTIESALQHSEHLATRSCGPGGSLESERVPERRANQQSRTDSITMALAGAPPCGRHCPPTTLRSRP